jgi:hypothetical protein
VLRRGQSDDDDVADADDLCDSVCATSAADEMYDDLSPRRRRRDLDDLDDDFTCISVPAIDANS